MARLHRRSRHHPRLRNIVYCDPNGTFSMGIITLNYSDADGLHRVNMDRDSTSIGRSPSQDIVLSDPCVSRHHAAIVREGDTYTVVDQNSTYGTFLNATRVERSVLKFEDILQIGSLKGPQLRFHLRQEDRTTTTSLSRSPVTDLLTSLTELRPSAREMEKLNWL